MGGLLSEDDHRQRYEPFLTGDAIAGTLLDSLADLEAAAVAERRAGLVTEATVERLISGGEISIAELYELHLHHAVRRQIEGPVHAEISCSHHWLAGARSAGLRVRGVRTTGRSVEQWAPGDHHNVSNHNDGGTTRRTHYGRYGGSAGRRRRCTERARSDAH